MKKDRKVRHELLDELLEGYSKPEDPALALRVGRPIAVCPSSGARGARECNEGFPALQNADKIEQFQGTPPRPLARGARTTAEPATAATRGRGGAASRPRRLDPARA